ncbi:hypothetical protein GCM10025879_14230 [Leuconostoc litchii]|uniref:Dihydropteroate synthase n=1 Tax=Leuconostoc litchii TaxID=1981069 RepID=A0A652NE11_9LACO|nr:dihydropteroate synthase [Leuconostoc litchii]TYC46507.1 dihydropteroate synthase [Leuconostoc litchii]GMA70177.1 hypothetical protein GCM10025879_14230 [Leuconostoc litchii]
MAKIEILLPNHAVLSKAQSRGKGALISIDQLNDSMKKFLFEVQAVSSDSGYWLSRGAIKALNERIDSPELVDWLNQNNYLWQVNDHKLYDESGIVYGVLNVSPESFYNGEDVADLETMLLRVEQMIQQGANVIEIGGQTTKPGYVEAGLELNAQAEIERIAPYITEIKKRFPSSVLAIDTYKYEVMVEAVNLGIDIINDVNGFTDDSRKLPFLASKSVGLLTMWNPRADSVKSVVSEMGEWFEENLKAMHLAGIDVSRIALDPGIGYTKNSDMHQDLAMMNSIDNLQRFKRPVMTAVSNKGWAKFLLNLPKHERADVSLVAATEMFNRGARILRVHDVQSAKQMTTVVQAIAGSFWSKY